MMSDVVHYLKSEIYIKITVLLFLLFIPFPAGNIIVHTPIQNTMREKYSNHITYEGNIPTLAGNKHLRVIHFFHRPRPSHLLTENVRV